MQPASASDYRELARRALPRMIFDYVDGGANAEHTLARNVEDFRLLELRQRVLRDASETRLETSLFGQRLAMPLILAPIGLAGILARRGEVQAARAANGAGIPFCLSTVSVCSLDEVVRATTAPPWFQLYMLKDRGRMRALLERASEFNSPALMFTVDLAVPGARYRDVRSGFSADPSFLQLMQRLGGGIAHPRWSWDVLVRGQPHSFGNLAELDATGGRFGALWSWIRANFDPSATWKDIEWVRSIWPGPIILKGILDVEDAREAVAVGADGIVVSNHGGRQLDDVRSSIRALPRLADALHGDIRLLFDGGIRSGLDILKVLALGSDVCMIGRLWAYALAAQGERGVANLLAMLRQELLVAMALTGCSNTALADRTLLDS
jgi:L-lactate dehydrogenase (cytochrome)